MRILRLISWLESAFISLVIADLADCSCCAVQMIVTLIMPGGKNNDILPVRVKEILQSNWKMKYVSALFE